MMIPKGEATALLWTYSFMLTLSPPFPRWCFWCWCATCQFVASLRRSSSPLLGSTKKKQLVQQEFERQKCEWHQCEARCRNANSANETKVWRSSVRMWAVQCEKKNCDEKDTVTCMPSTALSTKARVLGSLKPFVTLLPKLPFPNLASLT